MTVAMIIGGEADKVCAGTFVDGDAKPVVEIDKTNFPDDNFRAVISSSDYDRNQDGIIDEDENIYLRNIWCVGKGIKSLKGIEYFTELRGLYCMDNKIKTMDLSNNKLLIGVWCSGNLFTELDFTPNPDLEWLYCFDCKITSLNVANNPKMSYLEVNSNPLKELDVSRNPLLEHLTCGDCGLTELDLSNNPNLQHLDAMRNKFKKLDVTCCPKMKRLDVWDNHELGSIDVSKCTGLQYYNCANNGATSVDVSKNPQLQKLICSYNHEKLQKLDVSNNPKLLYLDCACNEINKLDLSKNTELYFLQAFTNTFKTLDISNNPFLIQTYKKGAKKDESETCKGHSWTLDFGGDDSTGGDNKYFLCFDDAVKLKINAKTAEAMMKIKDRTGDEDDLPAEGERVTREMVVQTLYEMAGKPSVKGLKSRFKDVVKGSWYEDALLWGEKNSICVGYPYVISDNFGVGKCIQRQDMALMLMRYAEYMNYSRAIDFGRTDEYIDYYDIDYYAWEALTWAVTCNIMEGKGEPGSTKAQQKIDPHGKVTREELDVTIKRMLEKNNTSVSQIPIPKYPVSKDGVGTISPDGKELIDTDGDLYVVAEKYKAKKLKKNLIIADKASGGKYKITKLTKKKGKVTGGTVTYMKPYNKNSKTANIKDTVKICGVKFKVTAVGNKAFKGCKSLTGVTIGKNVKSIGKSAFAGCKKLTKLTFKTTKLKAKKVGKNVVKGASKKLKISAPNKVKKLYKKIFKPN
ncbi:Leucine rich repeat-containing protein [Lachnospiraceae bacterium]|nr:Leucine rich repeat-containing protein [Lachnospiraceae bacterium]